MRQSLPNDVSQCRQPRAGGSVRVAVDTTPFTTSGAAPSEAAPPRRGIAMSLCVTDHVPRAADRMQQRRREALVDLGPQPGNVHVDHVGLWVEMIVPNVL